MIALLVFATAILVSVGLPPVLDRFVVGRETFGMWRRVGAYALMVLLALIMPMFLSLNLPFITVAAVFAVGLASYVDRVSFWGTVIVLLVCTVLFPATILILIGIACHVKDPLSLFLRTTPWHTFMAPFVCGTLGWWLFSRLRSRFGVTLTAAQRKA